MKNLWIITVEVVITVLISARISLALEGTLLFYNRQQNGRVLLHDAATGQDRILGEQCGVGRGCFSPDGKEVAIRSPDGKIRIFKVHGGSYRDLLTSPGSLTVTAGAMLSWLENGYIYWIGGEGPNWHVWTGPHTKIYRVSASTGVSELVYEHTSKVDEFMTFTRDGTTAYSCNRYDLTGTKPATHFLGSCGPAISGSGKLIAQTAPFHLSIHLHHRDSLEACCPQNQTTGVCWGCGCGENNFGCGGNCNQKSHFDTIALPPEVWEPRFATPPHAGDDWIIIKKGFEGEGGSFVVKVPTKEYWHFDASKGTPCDFWPGALPAAPIVPIISPAEKEVILHDTEKDTVHVTNAGAGSLGNLAARHNATWYVVSMSATAGANLVMVQSIPQGLSRGIYSDTVTIVSSAAPDSVTIPVFLSVGGALIAPAHLTATTGAPGVPVRLNWADRSLHETGFSIERKAGLSGTWMVCGTTPANTTRFSDSTLSATGSYFYRVRAVGNGDFSSYSNETTISYMSGNIIDITEPLEGARWERSSTQHLRWTAEPSVTSVGISISYDEQRSWSMLYGGSIPPTAAEWGDYVFTAPDTVCEIVYVKLYDYNNPGGAMAIAGPLSIVENTGISGKISRIRKGQVKISYSHGVLRVRTVTDRLKKVDVYDVNGRCLTGTVAESTSNVSIQLGLQAKSPRIILVQCTTSSGTLAERIICTPEF